MEELSDPVVFPLLSIDTQSEMSASNSNFKQEHSVVEMGVTDNFFDEGNDTITIGSNIFFEDIPAGTEMTTKIIFEEEPATTDMTINNNVFEEAHTIIEEGPRICPLCGSVVKLFFMNFNEQLLMCENVECDFPFGHEDLQIVQVNTGIDFIEEMFTLNSISTKSKITGTSPACSVISTTAWSDINKVNRDIENSQCDIRSTITTISEREEKLKKQMEAKVKQEKTLQNLNDIKQINAALRGYRDRPKTNIRNKKWLFNMKSLEEMSGVKLLTKKEKDKLKDRQQQSRLGEFKIDIATSNDDMSSINIQITNTGS